MNTPLSKLDFYTRYYAGEFGNRPQLWSSWEQLEASDFNGSVCVRDMVAGGPCQYHVKVEDLRKGVWPNGFSAKSSCRFNAMLPDDKIAIQGNVLRDHNWLCLEYSCEPNIQHRQAVRQPYLREATGLQANALLESLLWPADYDWMKYLLDTYDNAVIEFAAYRVCVGVARGSMMVIFEVRDY